MCALLLGQPEPAALSFEEALRRAEQHPELQALVAAARARRPIDDAVSSLTHNPELTVGPGYRMSSADNDGFDLQVTFQFPFMLSGLGGARQASARAEADVLRAEHAAVALGHRLLASRSWFELEERQVELLSLNQAEALAQRTTELVERAVQAGLLTQVDLNEARAHADEVALARLDAEGKLFECSLHLAAALAESPERMLRTTGPLPRFELPKDRAEWLERAGALPETKLFAERARAHDRIVEEKLASAGDRFSIGAQLQRESPSDTILYLMLGYSPSWFDDGARERAVATEQKVRAAEAAERGARENARFLVELFHEVDHTQELVEHLEAVLVPSLRSTHQGRVRQLGLGETSLLAVLDAERRLREGELRFARARIAAAWARARAYHVLYSVGEASGWEEAR